MNGIIGVTGSPISQKRFINVSTDDSDVSNSGTEVVGVLETAWPNIIHPNKVSHAEGMPELCNTL